MPLRLISGQPELKEAAVKSLRQFLLKAFASGVLLALPVYLTGLLMLKAMKSLAGLVKPLAVFAPHGVPTELAQYALALLIVVMICVAAGALVLTPFGQTAQARFEASVLAKVPGYLLVRGLTHQLAGDAHEHTWKPALVEVDDGLVPAFIIEELGADRYTVFVPAAPAPLSGSVRILRREQVHPVNASFAQTFQALSRWGAGTAHLLAAMAPEDRAKVA
jgi:uncharacterized membrane protein